MTLPSSTIPTSSSSSSSSGISLSPRAPSTVFSLPALLTLPVILFFFPLPRPRFAVPAVTTLLPPVTVVKSLSTLGLRAPPTPPIAGSSGGNEVWWRGCVEPVIEAAEWIEVRFCRFIEGPEMLREGRFFGLGRGM